MISKQAKRLFRGWMEGRETNLRPGLPAALVGGAVFLVYVLGACRTIYVGDSGELVTAAATLGIPHPSGYPLYVLLGKLWITLLPIGSVAFRMSLFSGFFGALASGLLFVVARRNGASVIAGLVGALSFAFAPSFWSQATIQRVYTLNGFFVIAVVGCALEWYRSRAAGEQDSEADHPRQHSATGRPIRWMVFAAFLAGLGAANHTVMGVVGLAVGLFVVITEPGILRRPWSFLACVGAGVLGLLPYLYLPWRSHYDPRLDWGNPETFESFWATVLRSDFWNRAWIESPRDWFPIVGDFLRGVGEETAWIGVLLVAAAFALCFRKRPLLLPTLIIVANLVAVGYHGSRSDIFIWHRYYIPAYAMLALLMAWGTQALIDRWGHEQSVRNRRKKRGWLRWSGFALLVPVALLLSGWHRFDRSNFAIAEDFSRQLLASLPPGAHLAASDDNILFVLMYLHIVEGVRPDVDLILQGVGGSDLATLRFDPDEDPLFFTHHPNWDVAGLEVVPRGLVFQVLRSGTQRPALASEQPPQGLLGAWDDSVPKDYLAQNLVGHFHYMRGLSFESREWALARREFQLAVRAAPQNDVMLFNLGLIYRRNGMLRRSLASFEAAAAINARHIPSSQEVRAIDEVFLMRGKVARLEQLEDRLGEQLRSAGDRDFIRGGGGVDLGHARMADLLEKVGEPLLARGHRLIAKEQE